MTDVTCTANGCLKTDIYAVKSCAPEILCAAHYKIWQARGRALPHQPASEEWRPIPGFEGYYEASDAGRIWSVRGCHTLIQATDSGGYLSVTLSVGGKLLCTGVHRLIALAFIGECPPGMEVLHGDNIRCHNVRTNLRYGTRAENLQQSVRDGTFGPLRANRLRKLHLVSSPGTAGRG